MRSCHWLYSDTSVRFGNKIPETPVILENSRFSRQGNGRFLVVADNAKIRIPRGAIGYIDQLAEQGIVKGVSSRCATAAKVMAEKGNWGSVSRVCRWVKWGGRIVIVTAVAADVYRIYCAKDRIKAAVTAAGGWGGAAAAAAAWNAVWAPADLGGPWCWIVHGAGTLAAGGAGYWAGSEGARAVYELLVIEDE